MLDTKYYDDKQMPLESNSLLKWMWFFVSPFKTKFFLFSINRIIFFSSFAISPFFITKLIDFIGSSDFKTNPNIAYNYIIGIGLFILFSACIGYLRKYEQMFYDKLKRIFSIFAMSHTMNIQLSWHENQATGNKIQKIFKSRDSLKDLLRLFYGEGLRFIVNIVVIFTVISLNASFIFIIFIFLYILSFLILAILTGKKQGKIEDIVNIFFEDVMGKIYEFASSIITVKFFGLQKFVKNKTIEVETIQMENTSKLFHTIQTRWVILNGFAALGFMLISIFAIHERILGTISTGVLIMIIWYTREVWGLVDSIGDIYETFIGDKNGFMRLVEQLKIPKEKLDFVEFKDFPKNFKKMKFENVYFGYGEKNTLKNINLEIKSGEKIALVGKSGAGKSTFTKLLSKQFIVDSGNIYIDNIDIKNIEKLSITKHSSIVLQDTELFNISIKDNILLDFDGSEKEKNQVVQNALKMSHSNIFVDKLVDKEDTIIGERGVKLSGGEKQRIGIARAIARNAEIIIFDEATSSLDTESEREIQKAMGEIFEGKTAFIIAHRLSTIKDVDRILVFDNGQIVEDGNFQELLSIKDGYFAKLWNMQKLD
ncbi:MAG: ABC transporter ATP-binding protein [Candidatus Gracilibacteria bacterium]|nr:ABC transporter ATP-binding protein [Candidatus Gracilibacteria bacterium]